MPFAMVRGVDRRMGVIDGVVIIERKGAVLGVNFGRPTVTNEDDDGLFPNDFGEDLFTVTLVYIATL